MTLGDGDGQRHVLRTDRSDELRYQRCGQEVGIGAVDPERANLGQIRCRDKIVTPAQPFDGIGGLGQQIGRAHRRQFAVVDASGQAAAWTGEGCIAQASHHVGQGYSVQANMMTRGTVVDAMARAYESATGDLAQRMLAALEAAQREGGDIRGMQSAALKVVPGDASKPIWAADYDLRVDEHENPVAELARLVRLGRAQGLDGEGHRLLDDARLDEALVEWAEARQIAPELEELPFWQAMALAEKPEHTAAAIEILKPALAQDPRREHWLDLIGRLTPLTAIWAGFESHLPVDVAGTFLPKHKKFPDYRRHIVKLKKSGHYEFLLVHPNPTLNLSLIHI